MDYVCWPVGSAIAKISRADIDLVAKHEWRVCPGGYARRVTKRTVSMHRLVLRASANEVVDHINGDRLDNRRENLRIVDLNRNAMNRAANSGREIPYKGVHRRPKTDRWRAVIRVGGKNIHLGTHGTAELAAAAYNVAAIKHFGEFARLNVIPGKVA